VSIRMLVLVSIVVLAGGWLAGGGDAASATADIDGPISRSSVVPAVRIVIAVRPITSEPRQAYIAKWRVAITVAQCRKLNKGRSKKATEALLNCLSNAD
jgi:hypothetical protein